MTKIKIFHYEPGIRYYEPWWFEFAGMYIGRECDEQLATWGAEIYHDVHGRPEGISFKNDVSATAFVLRWC